MSATDQLAEETMTTETTQRTARGRAKAQPEAALPEVGHKLHCPADRVEVYTASGPLKNSEQVVIGTARFEVARCIDCGEQNVTRTD